MTPTSNPYGLIVLNGVEMPKRIWLHDLGCGDVTWCANPDPDGEQVEAIEYVRADALSRLTRDVEEAKETLNGARYELMEWCGYGPDTRTIVKIDATLTRLSRTDIKEGASD